VTAGSSVRNGRLLFQGMRGVTVDGSPIRDLRRKPGGMTYVRTQDGRVHLFTPQGRAILSDEDERLFARGWGRL
jgi:Trk K+ transport system NAD-binding subunit